MAYLISQYPTTGHAYILREVRTLRARGWNIQTISIRGADRPSEKLSPEERDEELRTWYVKPGGWRAAWKTHVAMLLRTPGIYLRGWSYAWHLPRPHGVSRLRALLYFAEAVVAGTWIRNAGIPHVHAHFSTTVALILSHMFPVSFSMTLHGPDEFADARAFALAEKVRRASFVITISQYGRDQVIQHSPAPAPPVEVCRLGVDPERFPYRAPTAKPDVFHLLCVARLAPVKGHRILFAAMERLVLEGRRLRLTLAGDGPDRPALERDAATWGLDELVHFEGWTGQERLRELYRDADLFVLPSFAEGIPVVLMEAMAAGVPCVASAVCGVPELIHDGVEGLLVAPSDDEGLAAAIARLMDCPDLRCWLSLAAREKIVSEYNLESNAGALASILARRLAADSSVT
jgi:colanic acid/amylovoran biosynthesis glycosyltransferase